MELLRKRSRERSVGMTEQAGKKALETPKRVRTSLKHYRLTYLGKNSGTALEKLQKQTGFALQSDNRSKSHPDAEFRLDVGSPKIDETVLVSREDVTSVTSSGCRVYNEDFCSFDSITVSSQTIDIFGVFDGHGDKGECARMVAQQFPQKLADHLKTLGKELTEDSITQAITETVYFLEKESDTLDLQVGAGTTATWAIRVDDQIYLANVGDSRAILVKKESVHQLTEDANPGKPRFEKTVNKIGGTVLRMFGGCPRVNAMLAVGRDIGCSSLPAQPKITRIALSKEGVEEDLENGVVTYSPGDVLVLASDGLWDNGSNNEVAEEVRQMIKAGEKPAEIAQRLVQTCVATEGGSGDNTTVLITRL